MFAGGDQGWLETKFQRGTGCGSVSLLNQLYYFALRREGRTGEEVPKEDFLRAYYARFGGFGKPLSLVPTAGRYASLGVRLLGELGFAAEAVNVCSWTTNGAEALQLLSEALRSDTPAAIQNWRARGNVRSWHWVTVTGAVGPEDTAQAELRVSTWGQLRTYRFSDVWAGKASLVIFRLRG